MPFLNWIDDWNYILRRIIFADSELKELMMIPAGTSIIDFIDKYFIRAGYTNALLKNEHVRIVYSDVKPDNTKVPGVVRSELSFDIFVKLEDIHNATTDRLQLRTLLIAKRLIQLLTQSTYLQGYRFTVTGDGDLGTRTVGYSRYNISFGYMKVY